MDNYAFANKTDSLDDTNWLIDNTDDVYNKTPGKTVLMSELQSENKDNSILYESPTFDEQVAEINIVDDTNIEDGTNDNFELVVLEKDIQEFEIIDTINQNGLLAISDPDINYTGKIVNVGDERDLLERIVMGEAGGEGFEGAALVAQCIRDTMVYEGIYSVQDVIIRKAYSGSLNREPNQTVKDAVSYVFDQGGNAVQHKIIYFYAPRIVDSNFHESQKFIIEYKGHKFFSPWS